VGATAESRRCDFVRAAAFGPFLAVLQLAVIKNMLADKPYRIANGFLQAGSSVRKAGIL